MLGGAGGKSKKKRSDDEPKKNLRPGDLPPRRGREWNPGAGPRPSKESGGGARDGGGDGERLSNVWFEASETLALPAKVAKAAKELSQADVDAKEAIAAKALEERAANYERVAARSGSAETKWLKLVRTQGTAADKIAAATVLAQEDPVANLKSLESLLALLEKARVKGGKRGAVQAIAALQELFRDALLPPDRKLRYFSEQPLAASAQGPHERKRLLYWHVEDLIKRAYSRFVNALDALSRDPLPVLKEKSVKAAYELLRSRPEGERELLNVLVNKLGDPQRRTASNAAHLLLELVSKDHPAMKRVVAREVESFCFRRGVGPKAQYDGRLAEPVPAQPHIRGRKLAAQLVEFCRAVPDAAQAEQGGDGGRRRKTKTPRRQSREGAMARRKQKAAAAAADAADAADAEDAADELGPPLRGSRPGDGARAPPTPLGAGGRRSSRRCSPHQPRVSVRRR